MCTAPADPFPTSFSPILVPTPLPRSSLLQTPDESKTLRSLRFRIGDFVDIAIFTRQKREDGGPRRSLGGGPPSARTSIRDRLGGRDKDSERSGGRDRRPSRDADEISRLNRELERREREVARRERELAQA